MRTTLRMTELDHSHMMFFDHIKLGIYFFYYMKLAVIIFKRRKIKRIYF